MTAGAVTNIEEELDPELDDLLHERGELFASSKVAGAASSSSTLLSHHYKEDDLKLGQQQHAQQHEQQQQQDGDTRSEYSITDYERMKFVEEWLNSVAKFRFLRVSCVDHPNDRKQHQDEQPQPQHHHNTILRTFEF